MISDKVFNTTGSQRIFGSDFKIISEDHLRVFLDDAVVSRDDYDLINNAAVFNVAPLIGQTITIQVGTTPADILDSPTDVGTVAANIDDISFIASQLEVINPLKDILETQENVTNLYDAFRLILKVYFLITLKY